MYTVPGIQEANRTLSLLPMGKYGYGVFQPMYKVVICNNIYNIAVLASNYFKIQYLAFREVTASYDNNSFWVGNFYAYITG